MTDHVQTTDDERAIALRREVLNHARELFSHYGYSKTNIGDIAAKIGMSSGNLYRYFKNKQAIGEEVVREHMADMETSIAKSTPDISAGAEQAIRAFVTGGIENMVELVEGNPKVVELATMICASDSGILARHIEWKVCQLEEMIRAGISEGVFAADDPRGAAEMIMDATSSFWNPVTLADFDRARVPMRVERLVDYIFMALRAAD